MEDDVTSPGDARPPAPATPADDPLDHERVVPALTHVTELGQLRDRARQRPARADRATALVLGAGYVVAASVVAMNIDSFHTVDAVYLVALIAIYAFAYRTEFVSLTGSTVPTEPVLVAMFFLLPPGVVPLAVLAGLMIGNGVPSGPTGRSHELLVRAISGWHAFGPLVVLWAAGVERPTTSDWPILVAALLAQFVFDAVSAAVRASSLGVSPTKLVRPISWTFTIDSLLAPIGLGAVAAADDTIWVGALLLCPILLVRMLSSDRSSQLEQAVTLGRAYSAVSEAARLDPLTGIGNRRAWDEAFDSTVAALRDGSCREVFVLMADLDRLKHANDTFGHDAGDALIQSFALALTEALPSDAVIARIGGDEFGVILRPHPDVADEDMLLNRVRSRIEGQPRVGPVELSASLGAARVSVAGSLPAAIRAADEAAAADKVNRRMGRAA